MGQRNVAPAWATQRHLVVRLKGGVGFRDSVVGLPLRLPLLGTSLPLRVRHAGRCFHVTMGKSQRGKGRHIWHKNHCYRTTVFSLTQRAPALLQRASASLQRTKPYCEARQGLSAASKVIHASLSASKTRSAMYFLRTSGSLLILSACTSSSARRYAW
jgi:hypothetical protein